VTLELQATPEEVMRAVHALWELGEAKGIPEKTLFGLALALEESASNVVNHSLKHDPNRKFHVSIHDSQTAVMIELRDSGPEFDPTRIAASKPAVDPDESPGGWGIPLMRRYVDQISYTRQGDQNVLRLTKHLAGAPRTSFSEQQT
jgi:serine/threonine-protein kinase RsbW